MKLYSVTLSNFAAKCRIAIYDKGLDIEMAPIPGDDLKSPAYLKLNFLGKTPALDTGALVIPESEIINEYLEDRFPTPPLLPATPEGRARVRILTRFHDLYLTATQHTLVAQLDPATRDAGRMAEALAELNLRLDQLEALLPAKGFAMGEAFTLADCALAPTMFFQVTMLPMMGQRSPLDGRPHLAAWWTQVQTRPSVARVLGEMGQALAAQRGGG